MNPHGKQEPGGDGLLTVEVSRELLLCSKEVPSTKFNYSRLVRHYKHKEICSRWILKQKQLKPNPNYQTILSVAEL